MNPLLNPTGGPIRRDSRGDGRFGAPRTGKPDGHRGIDFAGMVGQWVVAPASGKVRRSRPYGDGSVSDDGIAILLYGGGEVRCWYLAPLAGVVDGPVVAGQVIGRLLPHRDTKVTPHCHLEVRVDGKPIEPVVEEIA